ncbi:PTS sugar transporter subunit IIC [Roseisolibacter sp. H3M3-2]|uniref:PTS sugar transporter subunit IIC n=1 Tax=Roseisolibacter sp. H3M3-2 TaxID=3031323 RepID=UPI0023DBD004|nr:PTS sugar transporter subunit IIC [Roseisolibacter sp. H3M3-2]MDF1503344.1 PTS sugar transporter subunit IIC [Roseisolibacter sp. H3M3-2]
MDGLSPHADLLRIALLGALLGLDVVSFPQAMISRPIVAATVAGALVGNPVGGLLVGAALELFALETLPVGASRYPEWGSASVVAGALYAQQPNGTAGALCASVLVGLVTAWVGGESMVLLRRLNGQLARAHLDRLAAGSARSVVGLQLAGLGGDFVRGFLITVVALGAAQPLVRMALASWGASQRWSQAFVMTLAAIVASGAVWKLVHAVPRARWLFAGGLTVGLAALALW